jgi:hypothetical protein
MLWEIVRRFYAEQNWHGATGRMLMQMLVERVGQHQILRLIKLEHDIWCLLSIYAGDTTT